jgi:alkylhydroperoxidase family enzyme
MTPLLPPIEHPKSFVWTVGFFFMRRKFGKVMGPAGVFSARMPLVFTTYYGKVGRLDKKLSLPAGTALVIREQVATINGCEFCMDATMANALRRSAAGAARFADLTRYRTSPHISDAERAALDYVTEVTATKHVSEATFAALERHFSEREICDIVWLVASEHLFNMNNIALNIGSDGFCAMIEHEQPAAAWAAEGLPQRAKGSRATARRGDARRPSPTSCAPSTARSARSPGARREELEYQGCARDVSET